MLALFPIKSILKFGPIEAHFQSLSPTINWDFCSIVWSLKHLFRSHLRAQSHAPMPTVNAMNGNVFGNVINEISSFQKFEIVHFISNSLFLFEFKDKISICFQLSISLISLKLTDEWIYWYLIAH